MMILPSSHQLLMTQSVVLSLPRPSCQSQITFRPSTGNHSRSNQLCTDPYEIIMMHFESWLHGLLSRATQWLSCRLGIIFCISCGCLFPGVLFLSCGSVAGYTKWPAPWMLGPSKPHRLLCYTPNFFLISVKHWKAKVLQILCLSYVF